MTLVLRTCACCGLVQSMPDDLRARRLRAVCGRCGTSLRASPVSARANSRAAAFALASLILYPLAVTLPIMTVARMGHAAQASILSGIRTLLADGQVIVGVIVLLCSVVFPLFKLASILTLCSMPGRRWLAHHHKALTYRLVEWTGRWGMLDVLLVAVLVAALKLGSMVQVSAGPGATAFAACVTFSLLAAATFDPHQLWEPVDA